jgi:hypothetical protein
MSIFTGQVIPLSVSFTDDDGIVDITGGTIVFNYWSPSNNTATPTGSVNGSIVSASEGTASGEIEASVNIISGAWKVQASVFLSGDEWPACTTTFKVLSRGAIC